VAGEVCVGRSVLTRLTDGVRTATTRSDGADPGRTRRASATHPPSGVAVSTSARIDPGGAVKEEAGWTVAVYRLFVAFSQRSTR